jgi:hypothetical protein
MSFTNTLRNITDSVISEIIKLISYFCNLIFESNYCQLGRNGIIKVTTLGFPRQTLRQEYTAL